MGARPYIRVDTRRGRQLWMLLAIAFLAAAYAIGRQTGFDLFPRAGAVLVGSSILVSLYSIPLYRAEFSEQAKDKFGVTVGGDVTIERDGEVIAANTAFRRKMNEIWVAKMNHDDQVGLVKVSAMLAVVGTLVWGFGDLIDGVISC